MATTTITAATPGAGATVIEGTAGATIANGQVVYLDTSASPSTYKLADAGAATTDAAAGFAITGAASGQPIKVLTAGPITGTGFTAGEAYFLNTTAGNIGLYADLTANTDYITYMCTASSTTVAVVDIHVSSVKIHA